VTTFRPQGWPLLALCARVARQHPDWSPDQVERRALCLHTFRVASDDDLAEGLRDSAAEHGA
jgi:hypothetical protein